MTILEMHEMVKGIYAANEIQYSYIGLRFEDKSREVGEECEWSKHNPDREDEREFPAFGSEEYGELETLDGTSVWNLAAMTDRYLPGYGRLRDSDGEKNASSQFYAYHCYIVAGKLKGHHDDPDDGEILIKDAVVIAKVF